MDQLIEVPTPKKEAEPIISRLFPFMADLPKVTGNSLKSDLIAGLSVAPIAIPQVMGYAVVAGLPPQYGLYAMTFMVMIAALWGSSRYLISGPTNAISIVVFATVAHASIDGVMLSSLPVEQMLPYVFAIAVIAGIIQIFMGLTNLGNLANYISHSVMVGFSTGAALLIFSGQLKNILGTNVHGENFFLTIIDGFKNIAHVNYWSLGISMLAIAIVIIVKRISSRLPTYLVALVVASLVAYLLNLQDKGVGFVSSIPAGLPPFSLPNLSSFQVVRDLFNPALAIAMLATVESITIGKSLAAARNMQLDANKELIAQGLANVTAGFTSGMPGCGSFSRSALNFSSGAQTRFSAFFTGLITLPIIIFIAPLAVYIPVAALAGILVYIAWNMLDLHSMRLCCVATKADRAVFIVSLLACLIIDLEKAVFIGVLLSLILFVHKHTKPRIKQLNKQHVSIEEFKWIKDCSTLEVFFVEGTLFFAAVSNLEEQMWIDGQKPKCIVVNLARVFWVDASGAHSLGQFVKRCKDAGISILVVSTDKNVSDVLECTNVFEHEPILFDSFESALAKAKCIIDDFESVESACLTGESKNYKEIRA